MSLLDVTRNIIIPAIEEKVVTRYNDGGRVKVCVVYQEDGAGLHQDKTYIREKKKEFEKRDWIIFNQPAQSPPTNVHDACIFPMMGKYVSREQGLNYGSRLLKADELHKSVMKIWADERNLPAITRSFSGHHQMVLAILDNKGDNNYLSERGGISFGIRKCFMTSPEGDGVIMVPEPQREGESNQEEITNHMRIRKLRYNVPKTTTLTKAKLSQ